MNTFFRFEYSNLKTLHFNLNPDDLTIFPNPASDELLVILPLKEAELAQVDIYNYLGQLVKQEKRWMQSQQSIRLSLDNFTNGLYTISVQLSKRPRMSKKFIVENLE